MLFSKEKSRDRVLGVILLAMWRLDSKETTQEFQGFAWGQPVGGSLDCNVSL